MATFAVAMLLLASAGMTILIAMHLWSPLLFFSMVMAAIFVLLLILRLHILRTKGLHQSAERKSFPGLVSRTHSPNTPMPLEPPLVRVLETFDLSQSDVEHFLDLPESGNTGGYSLERWKEAQGSLHRSVRD